MTDYTLHSFVQSGNAYKVALMLEVAEADWRPEFVDFMNGATRTPEYRALNAMGEVPVLVDHTMRNSDDELLTLSQTGVILYHLAERFTQFGPRDKGEDREILRWILWDNHKFTGMIAPWRFMSHFMKKDGPEVEFLKGRAMSAIKVLERHLDGREWVATDRATIADFSLVGYLYWPDHIGIDWADYPNIQAWLARIRKLPNWKRPEDILPSGPTET